MNRLLAPARRALTTLRIAAKQLRRNPRRARLIVALVALPSTVLMAIGTVYASQNPTADEFIESELGQTQAWVQAVAPDGTVVSQDPATGEYHGTLDDGNDANDDGPFADIATLFPAGTDFVSIGWSYTVIDSGTRATQVGAVVGPVWDPMFEGKYRIIEGAAPTGQGEVMLSPGAAERVGVGVGDAISVGRPAHDAVVVGILQGGEGFWSGVVYGLTADVGDVPDTSYLVWYLPNTTVSVAQQHELNAHGVQVFSRQVAKEARGQGPFGSGLEVIADAVDNAGVASTMGIGAMEMLLLAGAGFVVSMRSSQRDLAMLAANGAPRGDLVGVGVATGAWLGLVGGLIGVVLGIGAGLAWTWVLLTYGGLDNGRAVWGYHVVPEHAVGTLVFAVVVSALSALVPALVAARLDVVAALRGSRRPAQVRRWQWAAGAALAVASAALFVRAARLHDTSWDVVRDAGYSQREHAQSLSVWAVVVGLLGASLAAPLVLRGLARALAGLGVAPRIAARDAARNAARTVPVVAAIAASVVLATLGAVTADHEVRMARETPQRTPGAGYVQLARYADDPAMASETRAVERAILDIVPDATVVPVSVLEDVNSEITGDAVATLQLPRENTCPTWLGESMTEREYTKDARCSGEGGGFAYGLVVGGPAQLEALLGRTPTPGELDALASGAAILFHEQYVVDGEVTFAIYEIADDFWAGDEGLDVNEPASELTVPAVVAEPVGLSAQGFTAVVSPGVAADLGAAVVDRQVMVSRPGGITEEQEAELSSALLRIGDLYVYIDRPVTNYALAYALMSLGLVLVVGGACTAIALALARQEAAHDDATLASLGASPSLTKTVAAWHAAIVVFLAGAIGMALGLGAAWVGTRDVASGTLFAPWLWLAVALVAVPTLVGALAWVFTKAPKVIHYRLAA